MIDLVQVTLVCGALFGVLLLIAVLAGVKRRFEMEGLWVTAGVLLVVCVVTGFFLYRARVRARFAEAVKPYVSAGAWQQWPQWEATEIRGKLLVVDGDRKRLHPFHFSLPGDLQPDGPTDFNTVAIVRCRQEVVGRYARGSQVSNGYQWKCTAELVDTRAHSRALSPVFEGSAPPAKSGGGDKWGSKPGSAILRYLLALKRGPVTSEDSASAPSLAPVGGDTAAAGAAPAGPSLPALTSDTTAPH